MIEEFNLNKGFFLKTSIFFLFFIRNSIEIMAYKESDCELNIIVKASM